VTARDAMQWASSVCQKFEERHGVFEEFVVTGDLAEDAELPLKRCRLGIPAGLPPLDRPGHASVVGLLRVAAEMRSMGSSVRSQKNRMDGLKQKAVTLINEYF
jgi:hypothetical protein